MINEYRISNACAKEQGFEKFDDTYRKTKLTSSNFSNLKSLAQAFDIRYSFFFIALFFLFSCENDLAEIKSVATSDELKYETMKNVEMLYSDSAIIRVKVMGDKMFRYLDINTPKQEFPEGIKVDFFDPSGRTQSELTAKYALRFEKKNEIIVKDSVVWESKKMEMLETEELIWDEKLNKVYTKKFVKITRPGEIVYGYGFEANQDFTRWEINAITGRIKVDGLADELEE
jgi:LPS export ABC transporter protein LptC